MGRGSSKVGGGTGGGGSFTADDKKIDQLYQNAMNGKSPDGKDVTLEEVDAIGRKSYQLRNLDKIPDSERDALRDMIYNEIMAGGALAKNKMVTVADLNNGGKMPASINISEFTTNELSDLMHIASHSGASLKSDIIQDSLRLIAYWQNNGLPFA